LAEGKAIQFEKSPMSAANNRSSTASATLGLKRRRGRRRSSIEEPTKGVPVEVWANEEEASLLQAAAGVYGIRVGTIIHHLARGAFRLNPKRQYLATSQLHNKPWHIRWTLSACEFQKLEQIAAPLGQSVGTYCLRQALLALRGNAKDSNAPLLLACSERGEVARLQKVASIYQMIVELKNGADPTGQALRRGLQRMVHFGVKQDHIQWINRLVLLAGDLIVRAQFGAELTELKLRMQAAVVRIL